MPALSPSIDYATLCGDPEQGRVIRDIMVRVGDKWSLLVVGALADGPVRFTVLRSSIPGISQRMLAVTLRGIVRDGLVTRHSTRRGSSTRGV